MFFNVCILFCSVLASLSLSHGSDTSPKKEFSFIALKDKQDAIDATLDSSKRVEREADDKWLKDTKKSRFTHPQSVTDTKTSALKARSIQTEDSSDVEVIELADKGKQYNPYNPAYPGGYYPDYNNGYPNSNPYNPNNAYNPNYNPEYDPFGAGGSGYYPTVAGQDLEAFTARMAVDLEFFPGGRLMFQDTVSQLGNGWNNITSVFHCDTAGYFFFTFSICGERFRNFRVTLMKNGLGVVSAYGDQNGFQMASNGAVLFLRPGDQVYLELAEGGIFEVRTATGRAYNTFTGFRIL